MIENEEIINSRVIGAAEEAVQFFSYGNEENEERIFLSPGAPKWIQDIVWEAHGDLLPDDYVYEYVYDSFVRISDGVVGDDFSDHIQPDVYTFDLLKWLSSNLIRIEYVDEAVLRIGYADLLTAISYGQYLEQEGIHWIVLCGLKKHVDLGEEVWYDESEESQLEDK